MTQKTTEFEQDLLDRIRRAVSPGDVIHTLAAAQPNHIVSIAPIGILVETQRSSKSRSGPQLVPAWMIQSAWDHLARHGVLTNDELVHSGTLKVKRPSFVCALLSRFPELEVTSRRPIALRLVPAGG